MADLLSTFPGDVPGVLRRGSPVLGSRSSSAWTCLGTPTATGLVWVASDRHPRTQQAMVAQLTRDLTDPTARSHLAAWCRARLMQPCNSTSWFALCCAETYRDMTPHQIDTLARLGLRLTGRTP